MSLDKTSLQKNKKITCFLQIFTPAGKCTPSPYGRMCIKYASMRLASGQKSEVNCQLNLICSSKLHPLVLYAIQFC